MFAGPDIPGPHPARGGFLCYTNVSDLRTVDNPVAHHDRRRVDGIEQCIQIIPVLAVNSWNTHHCIDHAAPVRSKVRARSPRPGLHTHQIAGTGPPENPLIILTIGPIRHAPLSPGRRHRRSPFFIGLRVKHPESLSSGGVNSHPLRQWSIEIEDTVNHQWCRLQARWIWRLTIAIQGRCIGNKRLYDRL